MEVTCHLNVASATAVIVTIAAQVVAQVSAVVSVPAAVVPVQAHKRSHSPQLRAKLVMSAVTVTHQYGATLSSSRCELLLWLLPHQMSARPLRNQLGGAAHCGLLLSQVSVVQVGTTDVCGEVVTEPGEKEEDE